MTVKLLLAGMPESGKSTFIAALRYVLMLKDDTTSLRITKLSDSQKHLNSLENLWLKCERVPRTPGTSNAWVTFHVADAANSTAAELVLPDLSGETYQQPAISSKCRRSLFEAMSAVDGIALFTNADKGHDDVLVQDVTDVVAGLSLEGGEVAGNLDEKLPTPNESVPFVPEEMPEEAQIVELLQCMNRRPFGHPRSRKLSLIVSAWDIVGAAGVSPEEWFARHRSMLSQFLQFNSDLWDVRVYGVSAQGGSLPRERTSLAKIAKPLNRIKIVGHGAPTHDLTAPVSWLMSA